MIGRIKGTLLEKQPPELLVDVAGVAYEIQASMGVFYQLPAVGEIVQITTHLIVREDAQILYGFSSTEERQLFRDLIKVNGVGPKLAITILSGIETVDFITCIIDADVKRLTTLPGVGKRTAERLILELKPRIKDWQQRLPVSGAALDNTPKARDATEDAEHALIALGYKPQDATKAINQVKQQADDVETLIRLALQLMVK